MSGRETASGEVMRAAGTAPFLFVGEVLALDLVNTEVVVRRRPRDLLTAPPDLAAWWGLAAERYPELTAPLAQGDVPAWDDAGLEAIRHLRATLRRLFDAVAGRRPPAATDLAALNAVLQAGYPRVALDAQGGFQAGYGVRDSAHAAMLLPVALSARRLLTGADLGRLHRCGNERCVLLFYDTTRSGTRRWCSVACMDRARSAERYRRRREPA
jgi:predicted RNA-binding Zn ribbon-like protein